MSETLAFDPIAEAARQWEARWGRSYVASMGAVTSIMRVQQILLSRLNELLAEWGLTFPRYEALMLLHLSRNGTLPLGKISVRLQVHRTSVTNLIDGLERAGLVQRTAHPTDRRTTLAAITERGREVALAATDRLNEAQFVTAPMSPEELDALTATFERFRKHAGDWQ